jgi:hypothetical protein
MRVEDPNDAMFDEPFTVSGVSGFLPPVGEYCMECEGPCKLAAAFAEMDRAAAEPNTGAPVDVPLPAKACKADNGKAPIHLVPPEAVFALAEVLRFGAFNAGKDGKGYGERNWEKGGLSWDRLFAAAQRHLWAYHSGEHLDPESGLSHLAHAFAEIAFALTYEKRGMLDAE